MSFSTYFVFSTQKLLQILNVLYYTCVNTECYFWIQTNKHSQKLSAFNSVCLVANRTFYKFSPLKIWKKNTKLNLMVLFLVSWIKINCLRKCQLFNRTKMSIQFKILPTYVQSTFWKFQSSTFSMCVEYTHQLFPKVFFSVCGLELQICLTLFFITLKLLEQYFTIIEKFLSSMVWFENIRSLAKSEFVPKNIHTVRSILKHSPKNSNNFLLK